MSHSSISLVNMLFGYDCNCLIQIHNIPKGCWWFLLWSCVETNV